MAIYKHLNIELEIGRILIGALATLMYLGRYEHYERSQLPLRVSEADYNAAYLYYLRGETDFDLEERYRLLLAPIEPTMRAGHLVIAPHSLLQSLPFHALFDCRHYVGSRFSISYTPRGRVYYLCAKNRVVSNGALVLGIPDPAPPHVREEVEPVASVLHGRRCTWAQPPAAKSFVPEPHEAV